MRDGATVADIMCDASTKPTVVVQTCNEGVCAPRYAWRTSYGECSVTCSTGMDFQPEISKRFAVYLALFLSFRDIS